MNATSTVGWAPEPENRGTIGLIWSCLATIVLCTWNTVHPHVPAEGESAFSIFWCRVQYMVAALVAPEYMCAEALQQLFNARAVQKRLSLGH